MYKVASDTPNSDGSSRQGVISVVFVDVSPKPKTEPGHIRILVHIYGILDELEFRM